MFNKLKSLITRKSFAQSAMLLASGSIGGQVLVLLASPLLTRLYEPGHFGELGLFASVLSIFSVIANMRYDRAIPVVNEDARARELLALSIAFTAIIALVIGVLAIIFGNELDSLFGATILVRFGWALPLGIVMLGVHQAVSQWALRTQDYRTLAATQFKQGASAVFVQSTLGFLSFGGIGLIIGQITGQAAGGITLLRRSGQLRQGMLRISLAQMAGVAQRYRRFPQYSTLGALLNNLTLQLPMFALTALFGVELAGLYLLGQRVIGAPLSLIGVSISKVFIGEIASMHRGGRAFMRMFIVTVRNLLVLGCVLMLPLALLAPWVFSLVFGEEWQEAGTFIQILAPLYIFRFIAAPFGGVLDVLERQDLLLLREIVRLLMVAVAIFIPYTLGQSAITLLISYSAAGTMSYALYLYISWRAIRKASLS